MILSHGVLREISFDRVILQGIQDEGTHVHRSTCQTGGSCMVPAWWEDELKNVHSLVNTKEERSPIQCIANA